MDTAVPEKAASSSDEQGTTTTTTTTSPARSYDCTFCKRGFSNAQALGGHMNIHRRDKAKLKQASPTREITHQLDMISKSSTIPSYSPNQSTDKSNPGKWPNWVLQDDHDVDDDVVVVAASRRDKTKPHDTVGSEIRQLPLFDEKPSVSTDQMNPRNQIQEGFSSSHGSSAAGSELDLELRLGIEPAARDSSPSRTTKKFF